MHYRLSLAGCAESEVVGRGGLEPPTSRLSGVRSNHLSYRPGFRFAQQNKTRGRQATFEESLPRASPGDHLTGRCRHRPSPYVIIKAAFSLGGA